MRERVISAWRWLPLPVRAFVAAFVVLNIGSTLGVLPLAGNVRFLPAVPWALPVTVVVMAAFWHYFCGGGYPAATRAARREATRRKTMPARVWRATVLPIVLSLLTVVSLRLALPSVVPMDAPGIPVDLQPLSFATLIGLIGSLALSSGVAEEVAFRGYLQTPLEKAWGVWPAILVTGVAFWFAHGDKVTWSHLPFHLVVSIVLGLAVYLTNSLLPAIIGHVLGDALLIPVYVFHAPRSIWLALSARPLWEGRADTFVARTELVVRGLDPAALFVAGDAPPFALLAWVFLASAVLTACALLRLAHVTRRADRLEAHGT